MGVGMSQGCACACVTRAVYVPVWPGLCMYLCVASLWYDVMTGRSGLANIIAGNVFNYCWKRI